MNKKIISNAFGWLLDIDESACSCELGEAANGQPYHALECITVSATHITKLLKELGFEVCSRCEGLGSIIHDEAVENCHDCEGKGYTNFK